MTDLWPRLERLLAHVERPARYLDHEWGCVRKAQADFAFCMVYPDTYELGQANQAVRILTNVVDATEHLRAERAFLPAVDLIDLMREDGLPLFSLESCAPVREFDVVGITLPHELAATNVLETLDLAGIPLRAERPRRGRPLRARRRPVRLTTRNPTLRSSTPCSWAKARNRCPRRCWRCAACARKAPPAMTSCARWRCFPAATCRRSTVGATRRGRRKRASWIEPLEAGLPTRIEKRLFGRFCRKSRVGAVHRAVHRGGARPAERGGAARLRTRLPLLSGGHDVPPRARALGRQRGGLRDAGPG